MTTNGQVRYRLKTSYRDVTTFVLFDLLDFIVRLVALIPKPRVNLTRYHGVICKILQHLEQRNAQKGSAGRMMGGALASDRAPPENLFCYR